jgi:hypothetical protein
MSVATSTPRGARPEPATAQPARWRTLAAGALGGGVAGLVVGGVLGRVVMRVLALTSPPSAQGVMTDDQFPVGSITLFGTANLLAATTSLGAVGGLLYLLARRVLPTSRPARSLLFALLAGAVGGALVVHDHSSTDFSVLRPEWLAVVAFVALPALYGAVVPLLVDRLDAPGAWPNRAAPWAVAGLSVVVLGLALVVVPLPVAVALVLARSPRVRAAWESRAATVAGTVVLVLLVLWGGYGIGADVVSIVTNRTSTAPLSP